MTTKIMDEDGVGRAKPCPVAYDDGTGTAQVADSTHGIPVNIVGGSSSGTQYTEDVAAAADPVGTMAMAVRRDTLSAAEVSADGDNIALKATSKGQLHVRALDEEALLGALTETAPASDTASSGLNGRLQRVAQRLTSLIALLPAGLGSAAAASSLAVTASTEDVARQGIVTETAPASDTASSGQNGRLQRIAQRLTSLIALLPASLGGKAAGSSLSVTQAGLEYETVAASQTDQVMGATGATGDYLSHILIQPTTTAAGTVTVKDNTTVIFTFTSGTLSDLRPIIVPFHLFSVSGAWKITTGANVAVIGIGDFT